MQVKVVQAVHVPYARTQAGHQPEGQQQHGLQGDGRGQVLPAQVLRSRQEVSCQLRQGRSTHALLGSQLHCCHWLPVKVKLVNHKTLLRELLLMLLLTSWHSYTPRQDVPRHTAPMRASASLTCAHLAGEVPERLLVRSHVLPGCEVYLEDARLQEDQQQPDLASEVQCLYADMFMQVLKGCLESVRPALHVRNQCPVHDRTGAKPIWPGLQTRC